MTSLVTGTRTGADSPIPWSEIRTEWRDREYDAARRAVSVLEGVAVDDVDDLLFAAHAPTLETAHRVLADAFDAAAAAPDGELLLALYVYGRCLEKWEQTEDHDRIGVVLDALDDVADGSRRDGAHAEAGPQLLSIIVSQAQVMKEAMGVENALSCSCPVAMDELAREVVRAVGVLLEQEAALGDGLVGPRAVVRADAETTRRYFVTIAKVAGTVRAFVEQDAPGPADYFDEVLKALDAALEGDVYESELRAHRASLMALRDRAEEPRLRIEAAELVYLYPFALDGLDAEQTVDRALGGVVASALAGAGLSSSKVHELEVNDLWDRPDVPDTGYSGASIELAPITVVTTARERLEFRAEVRLSRLGNHHVRVRSRLGDVGLHDVNQALRRGTHAMGKEQLTSGERHWTKFRHYADDVIETVSNALCTKRVENLNATFHVVLAARSISVQLKDGTTSPVELDELEQAVGASLLFHPVRHLATSLEEWIRYPPPAVTNLLEHHGYVGDLVARTDNTTVTFMPASPEWLADEYQEMVEFVASLPPLLARWEDQALSLAEDLDAMLERDNSIDSLHRQELKILELEQEIRGRLAFLRSPALCRTRAQRRFLDDLWNAAGMSALESELERRLTLLAERQERIAALVSSIDQRRTERRGYRIEVVLGFLAATSLVAVLQWVNEAFGVDARDWVWVEAAVLAVAALGVVGFIAFARRSK